MQVMQHFDEHVVQDLEFDLIRLMLHDYCLSATARMRAGELTPMCELNAVVKALEETEELRRIRTEEHGFPALEFSELDKEIQTLRIRDSVLSEESFRSIAAANALVNSMIHFFDTKEATYPHLWSQFKGIDYNTEITEEINTVFDARGKVKDDASPTLFKIRQAMLSLRRKINRNFEKELKALGDQGFLADTREGFVNDRRVLAVMSTHKRKISGVTMGSSKTGTIAFIEPRSNVPLNFEYESLKDDEQREIFQILKALTQVIRRHLPLMEAYQRLLPELDFPHRCCLLCDDDTPDFAPREDAPSHWAPPTKSRPFVRFIRFVSAWFGQKDKKTRQRTEPSLKPHKPRIDRSRLRAQAALCARHKRTPPLPSGLCGLFWSVSCRKQKKQKKKKAPKPNRTNRKPP